MRATKMLHIEMFRRYEQNFYFKTLHIHANQNAKCYCLHLSFVFSNSFEHILILIDGSDTKTVTGLI